MSEMVERVARAIADAVYDAIKAALFETRENYVDQNWPKFATDARAAIAAMREPTEAMAARGYDMYDPEHDSGPGPDEFWRAMIDEALR